MIIAGIAALIEAHSHKPAYGCVRGAAFCTQSESNALQPGSLSQTPYDLLRIGARALLILGTLTVVLGVIGYWARAERGDSSTQ